ncbi:hypothetical protein [Planobispora rosea]|uniref:hypothetical protein n=1 Tax=Planobispora rosea TaxID=35762 RepID=UPI00114D2B56|nr:hypothetical protein [Planobispora rosea]
MEWTASGPDGPVRCREWVGPAYIAAGGLTHGSAVTVASAQGLTCTRSLTYGLGLDAYTLYPAMTRHRQRADLYLPLRAIETEVERTLHGPVRNDAHALQRAASAYARTLVGDRPDELLSPAPEPIARAQAAEPAPGQASEPVPDQAAPTGPVVPSPFSALTDDELVEVARAALFPSAATPPGELSAADAEAIAAAVAKAEHAIHQHYLERVACLERPYGLLSDTQLDEQIIAATVEAARLSEQLAAAEAEAQLRAQRRLAHQEQASADLMAEREDLAALLKRIAAAESAQVRVESAEAKVRNITQVADQRADQLAERYDGMFKQFKISPTRARMENALERAESALAAAHTTAAQARRRYAAALEAAPDSARWPQIRARHAELANQRRFNEAVRTEAAARVRREFGDPEPGSPEARVRAARLRSVGADSAPLRQAQQTVAALTAEQHYRQGLSPAERHGEDRARRDPAAARHQQALRAAEQAKQAEQERSRRQRERQTSYSPTPHLGDSSRYRGPRL